jgi:hypothetical protein
LPVDLGVSGRRRSRGTGIVAGGTFTHVNRVGKTLADIMDREQIIHAYCSRCGQPLGRYYYAPPIPPTTGPSFLSEAGAVVRAVTPTSATLSEWVRGPRTQPGLYREDFAGRGYIRKRCVCGANDKRAFDKLADMPVTTREDGTLALVF